MGTVFSREELTRKVKDAGFVDSFIETNTKKQHPLVSGNVSFESLSNGLNVHYSDIIENSNGHNTVELDACISINVLFSGKVSFALDNQRFDLEAEKAPLLFINVLNSNKIFTRYLVKDNAAKKLNISVKKSWVLERCSNDEQIQQAENLFKQPQSVFKWKCSKEVLALSKVLFENGLATHKKYQWELEQLALQIFTPAFSLLLETCHKNGVESQSKKIETARARNSYEKKIEMLLSGNYSLEQIALKLGVSISTLQRYFKTKHQVTLSEYIRNQKLEQARRALIFEKYTIGEVAYLAGYNHVSNFSTAFKKYFSVTPALLQKQCQGYKAINK